jgi:major membrane immunogen (membrane-anchored lipoprotein)
MKIRNGLALALVAAAVLVSGCSSEPPSVVGTWVGDYRFALADGSDNSSVETLVITRQEGDLLWGYEQWEEDGEQMRADLTGTMTGDNGLVLTESEGFFEGTVNGDTMLVVFVKVAPAQHTAFEVSLTRQ